MFYVRDVQPSDYERVYEFSISLLRHHEISTGSYITPSELSDLFRTGYLNGLVLVRLDKNKASNRIGEDVAEAESIGCMIYFPETSTMHGGHGVYLDQFYIEPEYRRMGLGRMMMAVLCQKIMVTKGNYIKLIYRDGLGLESVYGKMGFVNYTKGYPGLHLYDAYGREKLRSVLEVSETLKKATGQIGPDVMCSTKINTLVVPLTCSASSVYPSWFQGNRYSKGVSQSTSIDNGPPPSQLVIVAAEEDASPELSENLAKDAHSESRDHRELGPKMCMFTEQCSVCSWLGPMVNFSDFVGDTSLLTAELFATRIRSWILMAPAIRGAAWEVPCLGDTLHSKFAENHVPNGLSKNNPLSESLAALNVPDDTTEEGWNIIYLDVEGMKKLIAIVSQDSRMSVDSSVLTALS